MNVEGPASQPHRDAGPSLCRATPIHIGMMGLVTRPTLRLIANTPAAPSPRRANDGVLVRVWLMIDGEHTLLAEGIVQSLADASRYVSDTARAALPPGEGTIWAWASEGSYTDQKQWVGSTPQHCVITSTGPSAWIDGPLPTRGHR